MFKRFRKDAANELADEALLAKYQESGDLQHLGQLYERYMSMVFGVCLKLMRDHGKAEDAVMIIFESIIEKARTHEIANFRPWLYVTARNHCLMEFRKNNRRPTDLHEPDQMARFDSVDPEFDIELPDTNETALNKCLEGLAALQRKCVQLFYFENKSYKEIALMLEEELGQVRSFIQNGRRNLKLCLEKQGINKIADSF
ncbi:MAG: sigma-70 family RNA polymerase sigma factor [Saprospiraceae bacterium]